MDKLFTPDVGLMIWTALTFVLLLIILGKFGWKPLIESIEAREQYLHEEREAAENARKEAKRIQEDMETQLAAMESKAKDVLTKAAKEAEALRVKHSAEAQEEAKHLLSKARAEMDEERRRLVVQLRSEVAQLAVNAAEKLVHKTIDDGVRKSTMDQFFKDIEKEKAKN
jgi:F-type H+-transporting ATPase subunit b